LCYERKEQEARLKLVKKGVSKLFFHIPVTIPIYFRLINQKTHRK
jgi:hypothetical protein